MGKAHAELAEFNQAITHYVEATRAQVARFRIENQIDAQLDLYISTNTTQKKEKKPDEQPQPLAQQVYTFLQHPTTHLMLLHGDAGAGKSIYGRLLRKTSFGAITKITTDIQYPPFCLPACPTKTPTMPFKKPYSPMAGI